MAFQVVIGKKGRLGGKQPEAVTLNFKLGRIVILTNVYMIMRTRFEREVQYVRLLVDKDQPDVFLIQPCKEDDHGARCLDKTAGTTPSISARYLFNKLGLPRDGLKRCPVTWNEEYQGLLVHWKDSIEAEATIESVPVRLKNESGQKNKGKGN
jgi:hypothetical protein